MNALAALMPPFDVDQPNEHNSKREFLLELDAVEKAIKHASALLDVFIEQSDNADVEEMQNRLRNNIDQRARKAIKAATSVNVADLVRKNIVEAGLGLMSLLTILDLQSSLIERRKELKDQQLEFWSVSHRPPNYYARTIALRVARLYASKTGEQPTFGTSRDGGHPSTKFGKAVESIFQILGIEADIRGPVEWAISQLTDEDLEPPQAGRAGGLLNPKLREYTENINAIVESLEKGQAT